MAMIKCPECEKEISDKAMACPNCGYPMNTPTSTKPRVRNGKPTKLPNGYGSVYHLSGKRRKPFAVRKTDKWIIDPETGRAKQTYIIGNDKTIFVLSVSCAEFALRKQHVSDANSCASPGGIIANGKYI